MRRQRTPCFRMTTIEHIIRIAVNAHDGMKDMVGNPAVAHVLAVGLMGKNPAEQKAGFLHDVVEDSDITLDDLRAQGVEEEVLALMTLDTSTRERQALLDEILSIAAMHDRAERYIQSAIVAGRGR